MDIPSWARSALLALAAFQLLGAYAALRRLRSADGARRTDAGLDLVDALAGVVVLTGLAFGQLAVFVGGLAVQGPVLVTQLVRRIRARRGPSADGPGDPLNPGLTQG
ncbi:hypothetical protein AB0O42_14555 [Streptomyces sp. NPDC089922]|uniref:hypothetical protein n=1 Tax=Streptomyces sp. NPDC089922 TaxID=3155189 RepID=UPI00343CF0B7